MAEAADRPQTGSKDPRGAQMLFFTSRRPDVDRTTNAPLIMFEQNEQTPGKVSEGPRVDSFALLGIRILTAYVAPIRDMSE
jgi:hypothetical protein